MTVSTIETAVVNARPVRVLNTPVLMFVRITQVLNVRDDLNEKIKHTSFYNDKDSAKQATYDLSRANNVGYLWMTQTTDTLNEDGSVDRVNEHFMWTRAKQWARKETKAYTLTPEQIAKGNATSTDAQPEGPAEDANADF